MTFTPSPEQIEDLRQRLELVYSRQFEEVEAKEIAERLFSLYEELKS